jgi:hypothetical protein
LDHKELKVLVHKVQLVQQVCKELLGHKELQEYKVLLVLKDLRVIQVLKVHKDL